ncbi:uncharacterized protein LOC131010651 [Salvia miltiorrhiza]|uniref:uncharacterized protein LOC131010651 n=1 Tax=Salvia miltiorrhiza TaxID=226208 RepID=UPI0025AD36F0|nr:uncharacterized protein LOC131010651 [Salvia miltiorrhiza]
MSVDPSIPDRPFWPNGRGNMFSVKSGYLLACSLRNRNFASTSNDNACLWNWVWALEVIPKVKLFLWKSLVGALPTSGALLDRSIPVDPICRRCGEGMETTEHALRDCPWVAFLWEMSHLHLPPMNSTDFCSVKEWIDRIRLVPNKEVHQTFANLISQCATWMKPVCSPVMGPKPAQVFCSRDAQVKIKCDAALGIGIGVGIGTVMFDTDEVLLGNRCGFLPGAYTAEEEEARTILEGLRLCAEKGFTDAILETDCQHLYWRLCKREDDLSYIGVTLRQIYTLMDSFLQIKFRWASRSENSIADSLAKHALHDRFNLVSAEALPFVLNSAGLS